MLLEASGRDSDSLGRVRHSDADQGSAPSKSQDFFCRIFRNQRMVTRFANTTMHTGTIDYVAPTPAPADARVPRRRHWAAAGRRELRATRCFAF